MKNDKRVLTDELLKQGLELYYENALKDAHENEALYFDAAHEEKMQRLFAQQKKSYYKLINTAGKRAAMIAVTFLALLSGVVFGVRDLREPTFRFAADGYEKLSLALFAPPSTTAPPKTDPAIFIDDSAPLELGFLQCYTNPENPSQPKGEGSLVGIARADKSILLPPEYKYASPAGPDRFAVEKEKDNGEDGMLAALVNAHGEPIIPFFEGDLNPIWLQDGSECKLIVVHDIENADGEYLADTDGKRISDENYIFTYAWHDDLLAAAKKDRLDILYLDGSVKESFTNEIVDRESYLDGAFVKTAAYLTDAYSNNGLRFGMRDRAGKTLLECIYTHVYPLGENRLIGFNSADDGVMGSDFAIIVDASGKVICPKGKFHRIDFEAANGVYAKTGIAYLRDPNSKNAVSSWIINQDGEMLSAEYGSIVANPDGSFSAEQNGKTIALDADGKPAA